MQLEMRFARFGCIARNSPINSASGTVRYDTVKRKAAARAYTVEPICSSVRYTSHAPPRRPAARASNMFVRAAHQSNECSRIY